MLSLVWKFFGDNTPLKKAVHDTGREAARAGDNAGKLFGSQFKSAVLRFVGAGAIIGTIQKTMQEAVKIEGEATRRGISIEAVQELQRMADKLGITIDKLIELAPFAPEKFEALSKLVQESKGILDAETVHSLSAAADELNLFVRNLAPIVAGLVKGLNLGYRFLGATGAQIQGMAVDAWGRLTGSESAKTSAQVYYQTARDLKFEPGVDLGQMQSERAVGREFLREAQRNQQQGGNLKVTNDKLEDIKRVLEAKL